MGKVPYLFGPLRAGFFVSEVMDEDEYDAYIDQIDAIDPLLPRTYCAGDEVMSDYEQLRDENGYVVEGCYRRKPCSVDYE